MATSVALKRPLPESRYDLRTYWGRVKHMASISDPRTLFTGRAELELSRSLVSKYELGNILELTPDFWRAKKIVDATYHPETKEKIPLPFRMSCFALSGLVVTAGMLIPGLGMTGTIFWHTMNQSLNSAVNYFNATASSRLSPSKLARSYMLTVSVSCGIALSLSSVVGRLKSLPPSSKLILSRLTPFAAVASASVVNIYLTRSEELRHGIDVYAVPLSSITETGVHTDGSREAVGKSKIAARLAVFETAVSRVLNAAPVMALPALALISLQRMPIYKRNPRMLFATNLGIIAVTAYTALPLALAVYPQTRVVQAKTLEPELQTRVGSGELIEYNRGI